MSTNKIKILSESLTNKIAAGEVVERPASVVKELIENSLDAGSKHIKIIIKDGGRSLIQVADDGSGMTREDAILAFQRHTTSKIAVEEDLTNIHTLGFRGEALASITSISRVEIRTALKTALEGTLLKLEGGVLTVVESTAGAPGTSVAVKNLFYNTPARRKFMRGDQTEYRHILSMINRFTLAFHEVGFTLVNEGEIIFELKPTTLEQRIYDVLGAKCKDNLIPVSDHGSLMKISGYVGKWDLFRKSRGEQFLFLNHRYIINRSLNHAVVSAYGAAISGQQYPLYVIFFEIEPSRVDVNVHPTKIEVKFADEQLVYSLTRGAVSRALTSKQIIPEIKARLPQEFRTFPPDQHSQTEFRFKPSTRSEAFPSIDREFVPLPKEFRPEAVSYAPESMLPSDQTALPEPAAKATLPEAEFPQVWQLHKRYLLYPTEMGLTVIDQHVAHERILFERAMSSFEKDNASSQQLLFPQIIDLTPEVQAYLKEILPFIEKIGYIIKEFSGRTITIEGVPSGLKSVNNEHVLLEIIDEYKKNRGDNLDIRENVAKSFSCKTAIKSGEKLTQQEMRSLIKQLFETKTPYFCPHGRPIIINIPLEELDRRFGRA